jgi:hypothetical protein
MPWELGYMDASTRRVALVPIKNPRLNRVFGIEYRDLYPYVEFDPDNKGKTRLWIQNSRIAYVLFDKWVEGKNPYLHS